MRGGALALVLLPLAACGGGGQGAGNAAIDTNQIERLSRPKAEPEVDTQISARPQPLTGADLRGAGMPDPPRCDFSAEGHRLFATHGGDAIARINGTLAHFDQPSLPGPTGTFVTDRQLSLSIGRTDEIDPDGTGDDRWPARLTATNRRTHAQVELTGTWRCAAA
jgi:hypothetical protein